MSESPFCDDPGSRQRLMGMMKLTVALLMATALGCSSDVDLPLNVEGGPGARPSDSSPPLGQLAWSRADYADEGYVSDLAWAADGGLIATIPMMRDGNGTKQIPLITRHEADGTLDWDVQDADSDFLGALSPTPDGGAVVGISPDNWNEEEPIRPAGLNWYDGDGNLVRSWRAGEHDTEAPLSSIGAVQTLPDGRVFWAGETLKDSKARMVAGMVDPDGQLEWAERVTAPVEGPFSGGGPIDAKLAADGSVLLLADYPITPGAGTYASFVVNLALDGSEVWRTVFGGTGYGRGFEVAPSGNLVVVGNFDELVSIGDLRLEDDTHGHNRFVAELDPAGRPLRLASLELPAAIDRDEIDVSATTMILVGEDLLVGGSYYYSRSPNSPTPIGSGYYATTNRLDGSLVTEMIFPVDLDFPFMAGFGPMAADVTEEGRLALAGSYAGRVDFGDGEIDSGDGFLGPRSMPFLTVFDMMPAEGDVD